MVQFDEFSSGDLIWDQTLIGARIPLETSQYDSGFKEVMVG